MAIDRKAYREAKKSYRATKKSNKAAKKWDEKGYDRYVKKEKKKYTKASLKQEKGYRKTEKKKGLEEGSIVGSLPPFQKPPKARYSPEPEIKPIRSDYKKSKPQKATGSAASMSRMINMVTSLPEPRMFVPTMVNKPEPFPQVTKMPVDKIMNAATKRTSKRKGRR